MEKHGETASIYHKERTWHLEKHTWEFGLEIKKPQTNTVAKMVLVFFLMLNIKLL